MTWFIGLVIKVLVKCC